MTLNNFNCWKSAVCSLSQQCAASNGYVRAALSAPSAREHIISITVARGHVPSALSGKKFFSPRMSNFFTSYMHIIGV